MAQARSVEFTEEQVQELTWTRDHHEKPYMRERAAALLKVASGSSMRAVGKSGLLKYRRIETISDWITRYEQDGLCGLLMHQGRGRKPAFSPCGPGRRTGAG